MKACATAANKLHAVETLVVRLAAPKSGAEGAMLSKTQQKTLADLFRTAAERKKVEGVLSKAVANAHLATIG